MARQQDVRPIIKLKSTAGTGYTYVTRKNRRNNPDRIVLKKNAYAEDPFHLYYSSRRYNHPALRTLINIIREQQSLPPLAAEKQASRRR